MARRTRSSTSLHSKNYSESGLSAGVAPLNRHSIERTPSKAMEFITDSFLFLLGAIILCGLLYAIVSFT